MLKDPTSQIDDRCFSVVFPLFYATVLFWSARRDDDNLNIPAQFRHQAEPRSIDWNRMDAFFLM